MPYQQVKDVISQIRDCHRCLREWLEQSRTDADNAAVAEMMKSLRQEEHQLQIALTRIGADGDQGVLETWLQYPPDESLKQALESARFDEGMPVSEILGRKQEFDRAMLEAFQQMLTVSSASRVTELFEQLIEYSVSRIQNQSWAVRDPELSGDIGQREAVPRGEELRREELRREELPREELPREEQLRRS